MWEGSRACAGSLAPLEVRWRMELAAARLLFGGSEGSALGLLVRGKRCVDDEYAQWLL